MFVVIIVMIGLVNDEIEEIILDECGVDEKDDVDD